MKKQIAAAITLMTMLALPSTVRAADGPEVYKAKCSVCHGPDGSGNTPMGKKLALKDLRSPEVKKLGEGGYVKMISDGKGKMPAFKSKLSAEEITKVAKHALGLK